MSKKVIVYYVEKSHKKIIVCRKKSQYSMSKKIIVCRTSTKKSQYSMSKKIIVQCHKKYKKVIKQYVEKSLSIVCGKKSSYNSRKKSQYSVKKSRKSHRIVCQKKLQYVEKVQKSHSIVCINFSAEGMVLCSLLLSSAVAAAYQRV